MRYPLKAVKKERCIKKRHTSKLIFSMVPSTTYVEDERVGLGMTPKSQRPKGRRLGFSHE